MQNDDLPAYHIRHQRMGELRASPAPAAGYIMRFLRVTTNYGEYLKLFYDAQPGLAGRPYAVQHNALMADCYGWADFWATALQGLGYETSEIVANAEPLQKAWATENSLRVTNDNWILPIVFAQLQAFRPDVLFVTEWSQQFGPDFVRECRARCPSIRLVIGWCGEAHPPAKFFSEHDLVLSCAPDTVTHLEDAGVPAAHMNHCFNVRILEQLRQVGGNDKTYPTAGFIGQVLYGEQYHNRRAQLLSNVADQIAVSLHGTISDVPVLTRGRSAKRRMADLYYGAMGQLDRLGMHHFITVLPKYETYGRLKERMGWQTIFRSLKDRMHPPVFGLAMYHQLAGFKVCLNAHGPSSYASNGRLYEATGVGTCLVTDWKPNLHELFELDTEVVAYRSTEECVEKVQYLLDHEEERQKIATQGQQRTLRDHTFVQRVAQLDEIIRKMLAR